MKILAICLVATVAYSYGSPAAPSRLPSTRTSIVGGQEAEPNQFPWQISLQYRDLAFGSYYHTCGATIVDSLHIVCAAHCIDGRKASHFKVVAGAHNIHAILPESTKQKRNVEQMWMHENYDHNIITNDVSMLKLDSPLELNEYVVAMPLATEDPAPGTICINSGWGSTSHTSVSQMPNKLQWVSLPIIAREQCQADYNGINGVDEGMLCGGSEEGGVSPCSGDSGGPFVCPMPDSGDFYLAGIVSWGMIPCGQPHYPGVFTDVAFYREWIEQHMAM
jgi:secreted trypsin-like serine protease